MGAQYRSKEMSFQFGSQRGKRGSKLSLGRVTRSRQIRQIGIPREASVVLRRGSTRRCAEEDRSDRVGV